jgi:hypothetical protein
MLMFGGFELTTDMARAMTSLLGGLGTVGGQSLVDMCVLVRLATAIVSVSE